jgi:hypothetical protein
MTDEFHAWLHKTGYYKRPADPGPEYWYKSQHSHERKQQYHSARTRVAIQAVLNAPTRQKSGKSRLIKCAVSWCDTLVPFNQRTSGLCKAHAMQAYEQRRRRRKKTLQSPTTKS